MSDIVNLEDEFKDKPLEYQLLKMLSTTAILDGSAKARQTARSFIHKKYKERIKRVYIVDDKVFLDSKFRDGSVVTFYVCDADQSSNYVPFDLSLN